MVELADFRAKEGLWKNKAIWEAANSVSPLVWWKGIFYGKALSAVASRVLSVPATSASAERNWSTYEHMHNSKRNRLTTKRARKLVNIAHNLKLFRETEIASSSTSAEKMQLQTNAVCDDSNEETGNEHTVFISESENECDSDISDTDIAVSLSCSEEADDNHDNDTE